MAEVRWVLVERCQGETRRVTALDDDLDIVITHERDATGPDWEPDECQLLRAVELTSGLIGAAERAMPARLRRVGGALSD